MLIIDGTIVSGKVKRMFLEPYRMKVDSLINDIFNEPALWLHNDISQGINQLQKERYLKKASDIFSNIISNSNEIIIARKGELL